MATCSITCITSFFLTLVLFHLLRLIILNIQSLFIYPLFFFIISNSSPKYQNLELYITLPIIESKDRPSLDFSKYGHCSFRQLEGIHKHCIPSSSLLLLHFPHSFSHHLHPPYKPSCTKNHHMHWSSKAQWKSSQVFLS